MHTQAHERFQGLLFDDKVIGHPSFTHPEVVPNLYEFPFLLNANKDILKNVGVVTKQLMDPIDFHSIFSPIQVNGVQDQHSSKCLILCSAEKEIHTGLEQLQGE